MSSERRYCYPSRLRPHSHCRSHAHTHAHTHSQHALQHNNSPACHNTMRICCPTPTSFVTKRVQPHTHCCPSPTSFVTKRFVAVPLSAGAFSLNPQQRKCASAATTDVTLFSLYFHYFIIYIIYLLFMFFCCAYYSLFCYAADQPSTST